MSRHVGSFTTPRLRLYSRTVCHLVYGYFLLFSARRGLHIHRYTVYIHFWKHHTTNCRRLKIYSSMLYPRSESHMSSHVVFQIPPLPSPCWSEDKAKMSTISCTDVIPPSTNMSKPAAALPKKRNHVQYMIVHGKGWSKAGTGSWIASRRYDIKKKTYSIRIFKLVRDGWKNQDRLLNKSIQMRDQHMDDIQNSTRNMCIHLSTCSHVSKYALNDRWIVERIWRSESDSASAPMACLLGVPRLPRPVRLSLQRSRLRPSTSPATATTQCWLQRTTTMC